jgi:hypothetical protein
MNTLAHHAHIALHPHTQAGGAMEAFMIKTGFYDK